MSDQNNNHDPSKNRSGEFPVSSRPEERAAAQERVFLAFDHVGQQAQSGQIEHRADDMDAEGHAHIAPALRLADDGRACGLQGRALCHRKLQPGDGEKQKQKEA